MFQWQELNLQHDYWLGVLKITLWEKRSDSLLLFEVF